jgi:hypothetical protein
MLKAYRDENKANSDLSLVFFANRTIQQATTQSSQI